MNTKCTFSNTTRTIFFIALSALGLQKVLAQNSANLNLKSSEELVVLKPDASMDQHKIFNADEFAENSVLFQLAKKNGQTPQEFLVEEIKKSEKLVSDAEAENFLVKEDEKKSHSRHSLGQPKKSLAKHSKEELKEAKAFVHLRQLLAGDEKN